MTDYWVSKLFFDLQQDPKLAAEYRADMPAVIGRYEIKPELRKALLDDDVGTLAPLVNAYLLRFYFQIRGMPEAEFIARLHALKAKNEAKNEQAKVFAEIEKAQNALEEQTAKLRHTETELEHMRQAHYAAGDRMLVEVAKRIASKAPVAVAATKQMISYTRDHSVAESFDYLNALQPAIFDIEEIKKALKART